MVLLRDKKKPFERVNNLLIRFMSSCPSIIYGMFRTDFLRRLKVLNIDWSGLHFTYQIAVHGKLYIVNDYLYTARIRSISRKPYSLVGNNFQRYPFFRETLKLIKSNFGFVDSLFLTIIFTTLFMKMSVQIKKKTMK